MPVEHVQPDRGNSEKILFWFQFGAALYVYDFLLFFSLSPPFCNKLQSKCENFDLCDWSGFEDSNGCSLILLARVSASHAVEKRMWFVDEQCFNVADVLFSEKSSTHDVQWRKILFITKISKSFALCMPFRSFHIGSSFWNKISYKIT